MYICSVCEIHQFIDVKDLSVTVGIHCKQTECYTQIQDKRGGNFTDLKAQMKSTPRSLP